MIFQILFATALVLLSIYLYFYWTRTVNYWKKLNVPGPKPSILFGNATEFVLGKTSITDFIKRMYNEYKDEPLFGIFQGDAPILVVRDLDLVKDVLIKDFSLFSERGVRYFNKVEPLSEHLFLLEADRWRSLRTNLSPIFTSGKLREMFPLMIDCSEYLEKYLAKIVEKGEPVDCRELAAKFTTDVIGNCAFGIETSALVDENSEFRQMGRKIFKPDTRALIRNLIKQIAPPLYNVFGYAFQPPGLNEFFTKVVADTLRHRKENNVVRPDFINMLMELQRHPEKLKNVELTDTLLAAQAFVFFVAGFETSSSTISHALYELAQHHDIQDKVREEIRQYDKKYGKISAYDQVKEMKYLDKVFKETLRKYPLLPILMRKSLRSYTFKGTKVTIPKDTKMWIPVAGIQHDPDSYPNPEVFDPERFNEEAVASRHTMTFLPFGDGPRNCIGARFAIFQTKIGIITILRNYKVNVCEKTLIPYQPDPKAFLLMLKGGVYLKITKA